jgi:hypothetical protein
MLHVLSADAALSARGTDRTKIDVRFSAAMDGEAEVGRVDQTHADL